MFFVLRKGIVASLRYLASMRNIGDLSFEQFEFSWLICMKQIMSI